MSKPSAPVKPLPIVIEYSRAVLLRQSNNILLDGISCPSCLPLVRRARQQGCRRYNFCRLPNMPEGTRLAGRGWFVIRHAPGYNEGEDSSHFQRSNCHEKRS